MKIHVHQIHVLQDTLIIIAQDLDGVIQLVENFLQFAIISIITS